MGTRGTKSFRELLSLASPSSTKNFSALRLHGKTVITSVDCESERGNK